MSKTWLNYSTIGQRRIGRL